MRRIRRIAPLLAAALWCLALAGCGRLLDDGPLSVHAADEMVQLTSRTEMTGNPLIQDADRPVELFAAANETVAFQIVVTGGSRAVRNLRVESFLGTQQREIRKTGRVRVFRALPIRVSDYPCWTLRRFEQPPAAADFYDPLVPADADRLGAPWDLDPGERLVLWVDVAIPSDVSPGEHTGGIRLTSDSHETRTVRFRCKVYDFVLPDGGPLAAVGGFDHGDLFAAVLRRNGEPFVPVVMDRDNPMVRRGLGVFRELMRTGREHRLDLFDRRIGPVLKRGDDGDVLLDWSDYDAIVAPYLDGSAFDDGLGVPAWPIPFHGRFPDPDSYGGTETEAYRRTAESLLSAADHHFSEDLDAREEAFVWGYRGPVDQAGYRRFARSAGLARSANVNAPILSLLPIDPPAATGWRPPADMAAMVDILAPPAHWLDPSTRILTDPLRPLSGVWLSPGRPPYTPSLGLIGSPTGVRALPWIAMKYGCTGLFLPEVLHWPVDPATAPADARTRLFYPGSAAGVEGAIPSIRLKRLRRGLQDILYLWLLDQRQRQAVARSMINTLVNYAALDAAGDNYLDARLGGWVADPQAWKTARRLLAEEVVAAVHPAAASEQALRARRAEWRRFVDTHRGVRLEQTRTTVTGDPGAWEARVAIDLYNQYNSPLTAEVRFDELPRGWSASVADGGSVSLPPQAGRTLSVRTAGDVARVGVNGKMPLTFSLLRPLQTPQQLTVRVPLLTVGRVSEPPTIDGLLKDWPGRAGNAAGDFRLIGRRGRAGDGLARRQTTAYVLHDDETLYIAFRCQEPDIGGLVTRATNAVRYEQLLACGEDLVEVILDPGADAERPEQLYHLVIKPTGVLLAERGVSTDPPLGEASPWPVTARVAVAKFDDLWTVELAIPLSGFGDESDARRWGVNFTRFAVQGREASSWAEAERYFYDPRGLGTMFLTDETQNP